MVQLVQSVDGLLDSDNSEGLQAAHDELLRLHQAAPTNTSRYALAYTRYRMATLQMDGDDGANLLKAAQKDLEEVIETAPAKSEEAAEAMALLSGIMGLRIGMDSGLSMSLGPKSSQLISKGCSGGSRQPSGEDAARNLQVQHT